ncbi:hypothetical protein [Mycobacteroides abscessus]|uniref:hypothetical protein n=1 Tax=Mycobacteroides abscessus TaxID=36809 RepID=UPI0009266E71|nr:hypothetical protein [Mycobacteroides abscessus]SIM78840.1 Uncharacterised protein [Mycobacteroides abscessus subsp. abscessus]
MSVFRRSDTTSAVDAAAEVRRLQPVDSAQMAARPASVLTSYVELEHDELGAEQEALWRAEGTSASRAATSEQRQARPGFKAARGHQRGQRTVVEQARAVYLDAVTHLGPYRHREPGAKKWYLTRWLFLLGGDIAGQAGAALSYGEPYATAIPQALASGMAALTAGMVGAELRNLRAAARRQHDADAVPDALTPWPHLFRASDRGHKLALIAIGIGALAGLSVAGAIFWLRLIIEGSAAGAVYGLLAVGIALASAINAYFYADEIADHIDAAEARYGRELKRAQMLAARPELLRHNAARAEAASIRDEHHARGEAAMRHLGALKWRVLSNNPGVAGHGFAGPSQPPIGRRGREDKLP